MSALKRALQPTQTEPILGKNMILNNAGGYTFGLDNWSRLARFLILGTDGGTYYVSERKLTAENIGVVQACANEDPIRLIGEIVRVSEAGLAPKNTPAIFALAVAATHPSLEARQAITDALPRVARIGTDLYAYMEFMKLLGLRGQGRSFKAPIKNYMLNKPVDMLALHAIKYRQRNGWTYADVLRIAKPKTRDGSRNEVFSFMVGKNQEPMHPLLAAFMEINSDGCTEQRAIELISGHKLPHEAVPNEFKRSVRVQEALLESMPMRAMIRNLSTFARLGMLTPMGSTERFITAKLADATAIERSHIHPIAILDAMLMHASGGSGGLSRGEFYTPNKAIIDALDGAFRLAFKTVEPSNKRTYLALDVSGSMGWHACAGSAVITPAQGSAAMAIVTAATEPHTYVAGFSRELVPLNITGKSTVKQAVTEAASKTMGGTDCAAPMIHALKKKIKVDTFVVFTDNETWAGAMHPVKALGQYRQKMGIDARLVVVGMTSSGFSIADPKDRGMMDVVGFSSDTPAVISQFSAGAF